VVDICAFNNKIAWRRAKGELPRSDVLRRQDRNESVPVGRGDQVSGPVSNLVPNQQNIGFLFEQAYEKSGQNERASVELTEFRRLQGKGLEREPPSHQP
jgi:hypothetical protein